MANQSTMVGIRIPYQFEATTTPATVTLDPNWAYELRHNAEDDAGNADTDAIMLGFNGTTAVAGSGANLGTLTVAGSPMSIHGVTTLAFDASANNPHFTISPIGWTHEF